MKPSGFIHNILKFSIPTVISAIVALIALPLISHVVPADNYAVINLFYDYGTLLALFTPLGLGETFIRFYNESSYMGRRRISTYYLVISAINLILIGIVVIPRFGVEVSSSLFGSESRYFLIALLLYAFMIALYKITSYEARAEGNARCYNMQQVAFILVNRLIYIVPAALASEPEFACVFLVAGTGIIGFSAFAARKRPYFCFKTTVDSMRVSEMVVYGLPTVANSIVLSLLGSINKTMLMVNSTPTDAGIYALGLTIANIFSFIPAAFCTYWSVYIYQNYKTAKKQIMLAHDFIFFASVILVCLIFAFQDIVYIFIGNEYADSQSFFMLLMLWPIQSLLCETTAYGVNISRKTYLMLVSSIILIVVDVVLVVLLTPIFGATGAAIAFGMASIVCLISRTVFGQKYYRTIEKPLRTLVSSLIIFVLCCVNCAVWQAPILHIGIAVIAAAMALVVYRQKISSFFSVLKSAFAHGNI